MIQLHLSSLIIGFVVGNVFGMIIMVLLSMHIEFTNGDDNDDTGTY